MKIKIKIFSNFLCKKKKKKKKITTKRINTGESVKPIFKPQCGPPLTNCMDFGEILTPNLPELFPFRDKIPHLKHGGVMLIYRA